MSEEGDEAEESTKVVESEKKETSTSEKTESKDSNPWGTGFSLTCSPFIAAFLRDFQ